MLLFLTKSGMITKYLAFASAHNEQGRVMTLSKKSIGTALGATSIRLGMSLVFPPSPKRSPQSVQPVQIGILVGMNLRADVLKAS